MSPPCLESQGYHLIPLCYLLSCSSAQSFTLSVLSFSACWPFPLNFFQKILQYFSLRDRLFCMAPVQRLGEDSWSVVCAAYCHMTLVFAVMHLYNILEFFIASVHSFFILLKNLVSINRRNGPRYQRVLVLCAFFLTGVIPKGLILQKFCVRCLCMFCFM